MSIFQDVFTKRAFMDPNAMAPMEGMGTGSDPEQVFTEQVSNVLKEYMTSKFPWLHPESVLNIISVDLDNNSLVASMDLTLGEKMIRIPILFQNGNIVKPWTIFVEDERRMFNLSEKWYNKIIRSVSDDQGTLDGGESAAYWDAYNQGNQVINPNLTRGATPVSYSKYSALRSLSLMELMPLVKTSMLNANVYDVIGRDLIKVAAQKYVKTTSSRFVKSSQFKMNDGAFIITKDNIKKFAGLDFGTASKIYDSLADKDWCLHYTGKTRKTAATKDFVKVTDATDNQVTAVNSMVAVAQQPRTWGSYNKRTGEFRFLVPEFGVTDKKYSPYDRGFRNADYRLEEYGGIWNKNVILNPDMEKDLASWIEANREKTVPSKITQAYQDGEAINFDENEVRYCMITVDQGRDTAWAMIWQPDAVNMFANDDYIIKEEAGYLFSDQGRKFAVIPRDKFEKVIVSDAQKFFREAPSMEDYVKGYFEIKKNYNDTYEIKVRSKESEKPVKADQMSEKTAAFVLANFVGLKDAESIFDEVKEPGKYYKFAAQIDPGVKDQLLGALSQITNLLGNIDAPEAQKDVLKAGGKEDGLVINIDNISIGGTEEPMAGEVPMEAMGEAPMPGGPEAAAGGVSLEQLIPMLQQLGVPDTLIDQILQASEIIGEDPVALITEVGAFIEQGLEQGMPLQDMLMTVEQQVQSIASGAGQPGMEPVVTAANAPMPGAEMGGAGMAPMPAAMDAQMAQAGQAMMTEMPPAGGAPMPVSEMVADPTLQQVAAMPEMGGTETLNKSVLADIIANADLKTKFLDYLPVLNDTVNSLSEMILKVELNRNTLMNEVGAVKLDEVTNKLRDILDQIGSLILEIASFS